MTAPNLLHVHALTLRTPAGRPLFRDLTLILNRGDRVALVGRNGSGKSTLLHALAAESARVGRGGTPRAGRRPAAGDGAAGVARALGRTARELVGRERARW